LVLASRPRKFGIANISEPEQPTMSTKEVEQPAKTKWRLKDIVGEVITEKRRERLRLNMERWASVSPDISPGSSASSLMPLSPMHFRAECTQALLPSCTQRPSGRGSSSHWEPEEQLIEPLLEEVCQAKQVEEELESAWAAVGLSEERSPEQDQSPPRPFQSAAAKPELPGHELRESPPERFQETPSKPPGRALGTHGRTAPTDLGEPRFQWMWADAGVGQLMTIHNWTEINPLRWSRLRHASELASQLELRRRSHPGAGQRPVQVRREGARNSRTFGSLLEASTWIRSQVSPPETIQPEGSRRPHSWPPTSKTNR